VALLTDSNNHIRIDIPVNGDATDPSFTFQSAYGKKLEELFLATMVSPFSALGDYYNEGQQPPNQIIFIPGASTIAPAQQDTLLSLQTIIKNRPLLHISLTGYSGSTEDREILLKEKQAAEQKRNQAKAIEAAGTAVVANYGEELITPQQEGLSPVLPVKTTTLTKQELQDLAIQRSTRIKTILMEQYAIHGDILHIDPTPTIVPQSDSGSEGHRVEFTLSGQLP
ncbi:MAG: hypothetical protein PF495_08495, partial [Spirochaetales bacterium]|nr:hypothetical protein [Spirochaetales bacterium]